MNRLLTIFLTIALACLVQTNSIAQTTLKVACIGNSVTFGAGLKDPATEAYPPVLQKLLGNKFEVKNFGLSGATLLKKGHRPYFKTKEFVEAMAYKPDIAIIHLGLNDTDPRNWSDYRDDFEADYAWLLDTLKKQNPEVKLFVCRLTPIFSGHSRFRSGTRDWYWQIQEKITAIAQANDAQLVDLYKPLHNRPDLFADNLHPDKTGASIIAKTAYQTLTGDFGGLQMPKNFGDHMVLQRNQTIPVYGKANAGQKIEVTFNNKSTITTADKSGNWRVNLPALPAGGPYQLIIRADKKKLVFTDILIGDVWLCSGQSNMAFTLSQSAGADKERKEAANKNLRLFKLNSLSETNNTAWDSTVLAKTNNLEFFTGAWQVSDSTSANAFSAIAYYFGKEIQLSENVPIGLIEIAVGGSPIESWIDRKTLEHDAQLVDILAKWRTSDFVMPWVRERAGVNLKNSNLVNQRHPYEPAYNYEAGIAHLIGSPIKGVIWYQGESNAHNTELYKTEFKALIRSWREQWNQQLPFYYVQLSSIDRPSWPHFRNMQRELESEIPGVGMAVSSDLGDSLNVHPVQKKEIGHRLALLALNQTYNKPVIASGPVALSAARKGNEVLVTFVQAEQLLTKGSTPLTGFELITDKGKRIQPSAAITGREVRLIIPEGVTVKTVQYAWQPYTRANLINEVGLPASTFTMSIK